MIFLAQLIKLLNRIIVRFVSIVPERLGIWITHAISDRKYPTLYCENINDVLNDDGTISWNDEPQS